MDGPGGGGLDSARSDGDGWWRPRGKRKGRSWSPLLGDSNSPPRGGPRGSPTSPQGLGALDGPAERRRGNAFAVLGEGEEDDPTAPLTPTPGAAVTPSSDPRWAPGLSSLSPASSPGPRRTSRRSPSAAMSDFAYGTSDSVPRSRQRHHRRGAGGGRDGVSSGRGGGRGAGEGQGGAAGVGAGRGAGSRSRSSGLAPLLPSPLPRSRSVASPRPLGPHHLSPVPPPRLPPGPRPPPPPGPPPLGSPTSVPPPWVSPPSVPPPSAWLPHSLARRRCRNRVIGAC
jgi:hypothetical protein